MALKTLLNKKRILVTGACGTVGQELVKQLLENHHVSELVCIDNNESELFFLEQRFVQRGNVHFFLADVRDLQKISSLMKGIQIVFHTAAFKHVILCERSPFEAVQTNIIGVQNVITAARSNNVEKVIFTSSDKAVNPTNVMGTSKLMGERLMTAANSQQRDEGTLFASTRFGNVIGSRGSVWPIFCEQIRKGGPVTLTDPQMTRFIMTIKQAVQLVIDSCHLINGGCVFVTKMPVIRILDLAEVMIEELAPGYHFKPSEIKIEIIGTKPGEKLYEELMSEEETRRAWELREYFVVMPAFKSLYRNIEYQYSDIISKSVKNPYNSSNETYLNKKQIKEFLTINGLLSGDRDNVFTPTERYWP